jgi:hypothetical protein
MVFSVKVEKSPDPVTLANKLLLRAEGKKPRERKKLAQRT